MPDNERSDNLKGAVPSEVIVDDYLAQQQTVRVGTAWLASRREYTMSTWSAEDRQRYLEAKQQEFERELRGK